MSPHLALCLHGGCAGPPWAGSMWGWVHGVGTAPRGCGVCWAGMGVDAHRGREMLGQGRDGAGAVAVAPALGKLLRGEVSASTARGTVTGGGGGWFVGMSVGSVGWEIAGKRAQEHWVPCAF